MNLKFCNPDIKHISARALRTNKIRRNVIGATASKSVVFALMTVRRIFEQIVTNWLVKKSKTFTNT